MTERSQVVLTLSPEQARRFRELQKALADKSRKQELADTKTTIDHLLDCAEQIDD